MRMSPTTKFAGEESSDAGAWAGGEAAGAAAAGVGGEAAGVGAAAAGVGEAEGGAGGVARGGPCGTGCERTGIANGWMTSATRQISRISIRTRGGPHAISMGTAAPLAGRKLDVTHDFPLVQVSGNVVIECEAHQDDQQGNSDLLAETLGPLRERAPLDCFHQLISHLPAIQ